MSEIGFSDLLVKLATEAEARTAAELAAKETGGTLMRNGAGRGRKANSMLGSIPKRSYMNIVPSPDYALKDVVVFKNAMGGLTMHEVVDKRPGAVYTKGTFNPRGDGWIPLTDVKGKIAKHFSW